MFKPYYKDELVTIINGNSLDIIKNFPDALVITDPPFNINYHYKDYKDNLSINEYNNLLINCCRSPSVVVHYPEELFNLSSILGIIPNKMVAWVYPSNTGKQWRGICWFGCQPNFKLDSQPYKNPNDKRVKKLIESGKQCRLYDWWEINQVKNVNKDKTEHPCQMPIEVMRRIIKITQPKLILDPFCGSGTTLLAAKQLGIPSIGIDIDEKYCEISKNRINKI